MSFEAWQMPRGNIVVEILDGDRAHAQVISEHDTLELAEGTAARLNWDAWLELKPADAPMVWGDDWTERLLAILDKPYELEMRAAA